MGQNCPVSIELIVWRDTPTISDKAACDKLFSALATFKRFLKLMHLLESLF